MAGITVGTTSDIGMRGVGRTTDNPVGQISARLLASRAGGDKHDDSKWLPPLGRVPLDFVPDDESHLGSRRDTAAHRRAGVGLPAQQRFSMRAAMLSK